MRAFDIMQPDGAISAAIRQRIDSLGKPRGALGRIEDLAMQVSLIQQTTRPRLARPSHLLFAGDHGIGMEGVSPTPREVTWQQMVNFANGLGTVNMFCRQHGFRLYLTDVGVDHDLSGIEGIRDRKVAPGTGNFLHRPAMTPGQFRLALEAGVEVVDECHSGGCNVVALGEMGAANTSASSAWMSLLLSVPVERCVGAGSGLGSEGVRHKAGVLGAAVGRFLEGAGRDAGDTEAVMRHFGGFEMVAAVGAMLRAAELRMVTLVDGFIMTACALAATRLHPEAIHYMVFGHRGDECAHGMMLDMMGAKALLDLGMRLGEGTGALCAYPIVDSAVRMMNEVSTFEDARIRKYF